MARAEPLPYGAKSPCHAVTSPFSKGDWVMRAGMETRPYEWRHLIRKVKWREQAPALQMEFVNAALAFIVGAGFHAHLKNIR